MVYRCPFNNCTAFSKRILFYYYKAIYIHKNNIFKEKINFIEKQRKIAEQEEENLKKLHYPTEINRIKNNYKKKLEDLQKSSNRYISKTKDKINFLKSRKNQCFIYIRKYKKAIDDYNNFYQCFKDKNKPIYINKIEKYYKSWKKIEQFFGNYPTEINYWIDHKLGLYGDQYTFYDGTCQRWNYSKFPYTNYAKAKLIDYLYCNLYKRANLSEYEFKYDFGIRLDMVLDIIGKIENYYNDMIKNKDERFILMKKIKPNRIYDIYYETEFYKHIPKFPIYYNYENYQDFKTAILNSNQSNVLMQIKIIIVLFFIYERDKNYLTNKLNDNSKMIEKIFFIVYYISLNLRYFNFNVEKELCKKENLKYFSEFYSYFCYLYNIIYPKDFKDDDIKDIDYIKFINMSTKLKYINREIGNYDKNEIDVNFKEFINGMILKLKLNIQIDDIIKILYDDSKIHKKKEERNKLLQKYIISEEDDKDIKAYKDLLEEIEKKYKNLNINNITFQELEQKIKDKKYFGMFNFNSFSFQEKDLDIYKEHFSYGNIKNIIWGVLGWRLKNGLILSDSEFHEFEKKRNINSHNLINYGFLSWVDIEKFSKNFVNNLNLNFNYHAIEAFIVKNFSNNLNFNYHEIDLSIMKNFDGSSLNFLKTSHLFLFKNKHGDDDCGFINPYIIPILNNMKFNIDYPYVKDLDKNYEYNQLFILEKNNLFCDKYYNYLDKYYDENVNEYRKYWGGKIDADLYLESMDNECSNEIKNKIESLYKDLKVIIPSGWRIISKNNNNCFRIEPYGEKLKEVELPTGKSTLFLEGIYNNINEAIKFKNDNNNNIEINYKGNITKANLKEVYEDCLKMIMNRIISNKVFGEEDNEKLNLNLIKIINDIENKTEGFADNTSKKISKLLLDLNNDKQLQSLNSNDIEYIFNSKVKQYQKEINLLIDEEIKLRNKTTKPEFILLLDISRNMEKYYQNFVSNILYEVLIKLNYEPKDKIRIYTFNSEDFSNIITSVKNLKKFKTECDGHIHFSDAFKDCLEEMSQVNNNRFYLLTVFSDNICDKESVRSIAFKSVGISSKLFIKSRVIRFSTENTKFESDDITYGLLQQISTGDLVIYQPVDMVYNDSDENKIKKIVDTFIN